MWQFRTWGGTPKKRHGPQQDDRKSKPGSQNLGIEESNRLNKTTKLANKSKNRKKVLRTKKPN